LTLAGLPGDSSADHQIVKSERRVVSRTRGVWRYEVRQLVMCSDRCALVGMAFAFAPVILR
jgi:hypothetical protein